jgi:hypothetical protein
MNWNDWLEQNQYDIDFGNDTVDLMKQAYVAGMRQVYDKMDVEFYGESDFAYIMGEIKKTIEESE